MWRSVGAKRRVRDCEVADWSNPETKKDEGRGGYGVMDKLEPSNLACNKIVQIPIEASVRYSM